MKRDFSIRWSQKTSFSPDQIKQRIKEKLVEAEPVSREMIRQQKGLVIVHRGANYHCNFSDSSFKLRATSPRRGSGATGTIFTAKGNIRTNSDGTVLDIQIPANWGFLVFLFFWFGASSAGLVWNIYLSIEQSVFKIELIFPVILIVVGSLASLLSKRSKLKSIRKFRSDLQEILQL